MGDAIPVAVNQRRSSAEPILIILFSAVALLVHLLTIARYGYFRDELYYIACGHAAATEPEPPRQLIVGDSSSPGVSGRGDDRTHRFDRA